MQAARDPAGPLLEARARCWRGLSPTREARTPPTPRCPAGGALGVRQLRPGPGLPRLRPADPRPQRLPPGGPILRLAAQHGRRPPYLSRAAQQTDRPGREAGSARAAARPKAQETPAPTFLSASSGAEPARAPLGSPITRLAQPGIKGHGGGSPGDQAR